jgi:hypothetical protein
MSGFRYQIAGCIVWAAARFTLGQKWSGCQMAVRWAHIQRNGDDILRRLGCYERKGLSAPGRIISIWCRKRGECRPGLTSEKSF